MLDKDGGGPRCYPLDVQTEQVARLLPDCIPIFPTSRAVVSKDPIMDGGRRV